MAQEYVRHSPGPRFIGDTFPAAAENGDSFLNTSTTPKSIYIWDGNPGAGRWEFFSYLREVFPPISPPVITSPTTGSATQGTYYSYQITATNSPTSWNATGLPAGLNINTVTGLIDGTPTGTGVTIITLYATNAGGTGTGPLTLTISSASVGIAGYTMNETGVGAPGSMKMVFSTEAVSSLSSSFLFSHITSSSFQNLLAGYGAMGEAAMSSTAVDKLLFSSDSISLLSVSYPTAVRGAFGFSGSLAGYTLAGMNSGGGYTSGIQKLIFSSESATAIASNYVIADYHVGSVHSPTNGYGMGGTGSTTCARVNLPSEAVATISAALPGIYIALAQGVCGPLAGYLPNGGVINKLTFSTETISNLSGTGVNQPGAMYSSTNGYVVGGAGVSTASRIAFSTDTITTGAVTFLRPTYETAVSNLN